jgi:pantoate--beta-alanine ligase
MQVIEDPKKMQGLAVGLRTKGKRISLVSTSGSLNSGHVALIEKARAGSDVVVVSTLVNPLEFGPNEDYVRYPRNLQADEALCEESSVDILFRPSAGDLFPKGFSISVSEASISKGLCGVSRPHYFPGVCTLHVVLFNLIRPNTMVLGDRDAQKRVVLEKLVGELQFPIDVVSVKTVREESGLAVNARNAYLNERQLVDAATLYQALREGQRLADSGILNVDRILAEVTHHISQVRRLRVIYVSAVGPGSMEPVRGNITPGHTLIAAAVWCDEVRLIDNILL